MESKGTMKREDGTEGQSVFADLSYDSAFKYVFANPKNKRLLIGLLNCVLPPGVKVRDIVKYLDREQRKDRFKGKGSRLDLVCQGEDGTFFTIELQNQPERAFFERCVFYGSSIYHNELDEADDYAKLTPVYVVALLNHKIRHERENMWDSDHILSHYTFQDIRTKEFAPPTIFIIFVELARFTKTNMECTSEADWLYYVLKNSHELETEPPESTETAIARGILEASKIDDMLDRAKFTYIREQVDRLSRINRESYLREEFLEAGRTEGLAKGLAEGEQKGKLDVAKNLAAMGLPMKQIAEATELTEEQIQAFSDRNI